MLEVKKIIPQLENKPEMPKNVDEQWATLQTPTTPTTVEGFLEETESKSQVSARDTVNSYRS